MPWNTLGIIFAIIFGMTSFLITMWRTFFREPRQTKADIELKERQVDINEATYWKDQVEPLRDRIEALENVIKAKDAVHAAELEHERASRRDDEVKNKAYTQKLEAQIAKLILRVSELEKATTSP